MFDSEADRDMAILATTDLDIEPMYLADRGPNWLIRGETELQLLAACERQIGYLHAMQFRALARFAEQRPSATGQLVSDFAADEIALAAGWTKAVAGMRLSLAFTLTRRLPATLTALEHGDIDLRRAQRLAELTDPLPPDLARQVEDTVLPHAAGQNTSELARATRSAIAHLDPTGAQERHTTRKQHRRVDLYPADDAMAELRAYLPAVDATRIHHSLTNYAHAAAPGDPRTMDQRRADAFTDLLLQRGTTTHGGGTGPGGTGAGSAGGGGGGGKSGVVVHVTMPATMLMGLDERAGVLAGYGPIPADLARELAGDATCRRLLTDPLSGQLLDLGRHTYRPSAALAEFVRARDHRCLFPGCSRPADACDIDHRTPHPHGPTAAENLGCLCRHHHRLKHEGGWGLDYRDGMYIWTSPTGMQYTSKPEPTAQPQPPMTGPTPKPEPEPAPAPAPAQTNPNDEPPPF